MKGNDDEMTARSGKLDPKAKTLEKKGAPPPEQLAITIDKAETSKETYVSERATLIDNNVQTSASDVGEYDPPTGGITLTPVPQDGKKIASVTPYHRGEAESSRFEEDATLTALGTLQVPGKAASNIRKTMKMAQTKWDNPCDCKHYQHCSRDNLENCPRHVGSPKNCPYRCYHYLYPVGALQDSKITYES
jgi:hypothetical protein